jgi:hypothetical protein
LISGKLHLPVQEVPDDFPDLPKTGVVLYAAPGCMAVGAFEIENLVMLQSHLEAANIFGRVFRVELEGQVFHVLADQ